MFNDLVLLGGIVCMLGYQGVFFAARLLSTIFGVELESVGGLAIGGGITATLAFVSIAFLRRTREQDDRSTEQSDNYVAWADKRLAWEENRADEAIKKAERLEQQIIEMARTHLRELAEKDQVILKLHRVNAEQSGLINMLNQNQVQMVREIEVGDQE